MQRFNLLKLIVLLNEEYLIKHVFPMTFAADPE